MLAPELHPSPKYMRAALPLCSGSKEELAASPGPSNNRSTHALPHGSPLSEPKACEALSGYKSPRDLALAVDLLDPEALAFQFLLCIA